MKCQLIGDCNGLKPGLHGLNINSGYMVFSHYDPHDKPHGGPETSQRHIGDLGNIEADENGDSHFELEDNLVSLFGDYSIYGRSLVVHENADDLGYGVNYLSKITGNSGKIVASGIIGVSEKPL